MPYLIKEALNISSTSTCSCLHLSSYFDEFVLGELALSCHLALDLLCDNADVRCAYARYLANIALCECL